MMTATTSQHSPALARWRPYLIFWSLFFATLILDHATKAWIVHGSGYILGQTPPRSGTVIIPGFFNLIYTVNKGAAWGIGEGLGIIFVVIAAAVLYGLYRYREALELRRLPYQIAFGLITGGIVGNAIDRLLRQHVVDFLDFDLQFYHWPTFNIADIGIVVGTAWMLIFSTFLDKKKEPSLGETILK
jgi:signal peptidase II